MQEQHVNPYILAAGILGAWIIISIPTALILGAVIRRRNQHG